MASRTFCIGTLFFCALMLLAGQIHAQATFLVGSSINTSADIGATELTGQISLTVSSGVSVASPLLIKYAAPITNNAASEIIVSGTGGLSTITSTPVLDRAGNTIRIDVPAGGGPSSEIRIAGVRVSLAGLGLTSVSANITAPVATGNTIVAGQGTVVVIGSVQQPFTVNLGINSLRVDNTTSSTTTFSFIISETYSTAFSSSVGSYGQTVATRIRLNPFPSIPSGVTLRFPRTATCAETGATLTTLSNQDETVPRADGTTTVVYQYASAAASDSTTESFPFEATATVTPPAGTGTIAVQATLLPIGIATPNAAFPSKDIPRYTERAVPDEADLLTGIVKLAFPFLSQTYVGAYTGIALTNPIPYRAKVTLAAYDEDGKLIGGPGITNPVNLILPPNGQYARLANEVFGSSFNASTSGTIIATGYSDSMRGLYLEGGTISGDGLDGADGDLAAKRTWVWPTLFHQGPSPATVLRMYNPSAGPANVTLKLYDESGTLVATSIASIAAGGTRVVDAKDVFSGSNLDALAGGYLTGSSNVGLSVSEIFGNRVASNVLPGQVGAQNATLLVPHFVNGAGYSTELTFVNMDPAVAGHLTLTLLDNSGKSVGGGSALVSLPPGAQKIQTIDQLFPALGSSFTTGYVRIDLEQRYLGPFATTAPIVGSVRFTAADGVGSTALPFSVPATQNFVYSHVAQDLGYFSGVAIINPNPTTAEMTLEVLAEDGSVVGSTAIELQPGYKIAKLLDELVPKSAGQLGGYVRVRSTVPVVSFSVFGTTDGRALSAIPAQDITQ